MQVGALTIADMACHPWIDAYDKAPIDMEPYPAVRRWHADVAARPAARRAYTLGEQVRPGGQQPMSDAERKVLFGGGR